MADLSSSSIPKAIGSTVKKSSDVTRQGTQKLKFVPTLPQRRKKEEVKPEPATVVMPPATERGRGRGRGRGEGRGRGRGRGGPPVVEMTASGPFAMGPAMAGGSSRRSAPRSNFAPSLPVNSDMSTTYGNLSQSAPPSLRNDLTNGNAPLKAEEEQYSDPDEGVEIVDMDNVRQMDWMAPESIRKDKKEAKAKKVKKEEIADDGVAATTVDPQNALNLSESEEEEELEDIIEDFAAQNNIDSGQPIQEDRLYFFQFPSPFPKFAYKDPPPMDVDVVEPAIVPEASTSAKKVSFAADVKPDIASDSRTPSTVPSEPKQEQPLDGIVGQLEVYRSGAVKIRLGNGILLDVSAATQPSFLQQAVVLDHDKKQLHVLGEVNKQFVVSPNVDALLSALETQHSSIIEGEENMIKMD